MEHGIPMDRFPLYTHQQEALLASFGDSPNLLVASGTGSAKTEAFVLPILSRLLGEARGWDAPSTREAPGHFDTGPISGATPGATKPERPVSGQ